MQYGIRFTGRAERALVLAQESAMELKQKYVGSEHILLGLAKEGGGVASKTLYGHRITAEAISQIIQQLIDQDNQQDFQNTLTPCGKRILELSYTQSKRFNSKYIGTEHMLMAILREGDSVAMRVLNALNADIHRIYSDTISIITGGKPDVIMETKIKDTPTLNKFGKDLTEIAKNNGFDPIIGRKTEIDRVMQILTRRTKNNPCLIGEPGVGKTAIAEGLAQKIAFDNAPDILKEKRVVSVDLSSIVAGTKFRGEFEERLKKVVTEVIQAKNIILFIDEIHTIIGAGGAEGAIDAANILKPSLARGEIQLIGATTTKEYKKYIEKDTALERRFQPVIINEPTAAEAKQILFGIRDKYEVHHNVAISDEAIDAAVDLSSRYIADRFLPDKAIDLIDETASKLRIAAHKTPSLIIELQNEVEKLSAEKEEAIKEQEYEKAANFRDKELELTDKLQNEIEKYHNKKNNKKQVTAKDIGQSVSSQTGIPVTMLEENEKAKLLKLEDRLTKEVIGQENAVTALVKAIKRSRVGISDPRRPIGSFIFLGPTGVGKTKLTKALCVAMFGNEKPLIKLDMSEYMEKHSVSKIIGSPPGYVGFEDGGQLTEKVRRNPYSVILFDEIEKAHSDVFNILLQILEDGELTDSQGRRVNFKNTILILTSNAGAKEISQAKTLGFVENENTQNSIKNYETMKKSLMKELKNTFNPEFLNRVDDIIVFNQLSKDDIMTIALLMLNVLKKRLKEKEYNIKFTSKLVKMLVEVGYDKQYGARPLRRAIQNKVEDFITDNILEGNIIQNKPVTIDFTDKIYIK